MGKVESWGDEVARMISEVHVSANEMWSGSCVVNVNSEEPARLAGILKQTAGRFKIWMVRAVLKKIS